MKFHRRHDRGKILKTIKQWEEDGERETMYKSSGFLVYLKQYISNVLVSSKNNNSQKNPCYLRIQLNF